MKYGLWAAKGVVFLLLIILMLNVFSGPKMSKEDFGVVLSKVQENLDIIALLQHDNKSIRNNLGLYPEAYELIAYFKIDAVIHANEYVLLQLKDPDQKNAFQQAIESRIAEQTNLYDGYAPDQVQLLKQAVVDIQANYALYVFDTNAKTMDEQFLESL